MPFDVTRVERSDHHALRFRNRTVEQDTLPVLCQFDANREGATKAYVLDLGHKKHSQDRARNIMISI
jgi:hypothetical protein